MKGIEAEASSAFSSLASLVFRSVPSRPQWQGSAFRTFLTDQLDAVMATHWCQNIMKVGDSDQRLVNKSFTELTVVRGLTNHVNFATHTLGSSLDLVLFSFLGDSVACSPLRAGSSDHNAVVSEAELNLAP